MRDEIMIRVTNYANRLLGALTIILASVVFLYSAYVIFDDFLISRNAFPDWDLIQYKPSGRAEDDPDYQKLKEINHDVAGWLTIDGTNIDYPVLQGRDDIEYSNKDVYGKFSPSGSIYMAVDCKKDFSDPYILIYGHHMDNGSMFGDIDKYEDISFLKAHNKGLIQTENGNYDLRAFACVKTNAYVFLIYSPQGKDYRTLKQFIKENAVSYDRKAAGMEGRLVALSTCADADTNGRAVLFLKMMPHKGPLKVKTKKEIKREAAGHRNNKRKLAVLNLACLVFILYTFVPVGNIRRKYGQIFYSVKMIKYPDGQDVRVTDSLKKYLVLLSAGTGIELLLTVSSAVIFFTTESFQKNPAVIDKWTPVMIGLSFGILATDFCCFRYRGIRPGEASVGRDVS